MAALATTSSLSNYPKLNISRYRDQLRRSGKASSIELNYSYRGKSYRYYVQLTRTSCNYGNYRHWWLCPLCSKRVSVLYCAGAYGSQLQQPIDRLFSRAGAIRARLGWVAGIAHGYGERPKGMHHSTYYRLLNEYDLLVRQICGVSMEMLDKIKGSISYE